MATRTDHFKVAGSLPIIMNLGWAKQFPLLVALVLVDMATIAAGFWLAFYIRFGLNFSWFYRHSETPLEFYQQVTIFLTPVWIIIFGLFGLYSFKNLFSGTREYAQAFNACTLSIMLLILFTFFDTNFFIARAWVVLSWALVSLCVIAGRFFFRRGVHYVRQRGHFTTKMLVVGANGEGQAIVEQFKADTKAGIKIAGFVDDNQAPGSEPVPGTVVLGTVDSITKCVEEHEIQEVIIVSTALTREKLLDLFQTLSEVDVFVRISSGLYELLTTGVEVHEVGNVPLLSINKVRLTGGDVVMKRGLDFIGSTIALLIFLPLMAIIAIAVKLDSSGPILYRRRVVGVGGRPFDAFKFRTMCVDADEKLAQNPELLRLFEQNFKLKDDPRITRVGRLLRSTSLDELPQLFNVLLGQMSLVGPRMITAPERAHYGQRSMNLSTVKPGITGLWQVSGRSDVSYDERVKLDMHYIRNYSIWLDLYLLWQTVPAVLQKRGAY